jgi:hypothetical protein
MPGADRTTARRGGPLVSRLAERLAGERQIAATATGAAGH